jgi:hypothetical protein
MFAWSIRVCVNSEPGLVPKLHAKRQGNLPVMISLWTSWNRAREPEYATAHFDQFLDTVAGVIFSEVLLVNGIKKHAATHFESYDQYCSHEQILSSYRSSIVRFFAQ